MSSCDKNQPPFLLRYLTSSRFIVRVTSAIGQALFQMGSSQPDGSDDLQTLWAVEGKKINLQKGTSRVPERLFLPSLLKTLSDSNTEKENIDYNNFDKIEVIFFDILLAPCWTRNV